METRPETPGSPTPAGARGAGPGELATLDELDDYKVSDQDPDPHGWPVIAGDGVAIGRVDQLVVDTFVRKVRYLDCLLRPGLPGLGEPDRHILIPVGFARLDETGERVIVDTLTSPDAVRLPPYTGLPLHREFEEHIRQAFRGMGNREVES